MKTFHFGNSDNDPCKDAPTDGCYEPVCRFALTSTGALDGEQWCDTTSVPKREFTPCGDGDGGDSSGDGSTLKCLHADWTNKSSVLECRAREKCYDLACTADDIALDKYRTPCYGYNTTAMQWDGGFTPACDEGTGVCMVPAVAAAVTEQEVVCDDELGYTSNDRCLPSGACQGNIQV